MFFTVWMLVSGGETLEAQTNRKIKALQTQKKEIQKGLTRSRKELKTTEKTVATKLRDISMIANRLEARQRYIDTMEVQLKKVSDQVNALERKVERTAAELETKKADYAKALRYAGLQVGGKSFAFRAFHPFCDSDVPSFALCPGICQLSAYVG